MAENEEKKAEEQAEAAPEQKADDAGGEAKQEAAQEAPKEAEAPAAADAAEEEVSEEEEAKLKLPFPTAAVVRIMKAHMDGEKMIRKDVKVAMNKWLGSMCAQVSTEMNKFPYVMMHLNELNEAKRVYEDLENFQKEKDRILAHLDAIKKDIEKLERDLGKEEGEVIIVKKKEEVSNDGA